MINDSKYSLRWFTLCQIVLGKKGIFMLLFLVFVLAVLCIIFALYMSLFPLVSIDVTVICIPQSVYAKSRGEIAASFLIFQDN